MTQTTRIRLAQADDAQALCTVLIRSIREICGPDYGNAPALLEHWCSNKTPDNVRQWIADPDSHFIVAERDDEVVGAGLISRSGDLRICYLVPEVKGLGVGRLILDRLLEFAQKDGVSVVELGSTITAKGFHEHHGFEVVEARLDDVIPQFKMRKSVASEDERH